MSNLKIPEEITCLEVVAYWERMREKTWGTGYSIFRSGPLKDIVCDDLHMVAIMWDVNTGYIYQSNHEAGLAMMRHLGYAPTPIEEAVP